MVKIVSFVAATLLFISCSQGTTDKQVNKSPNIIFILTDDQGWTHTSHRADPDIPESASD